MKFRVSILAVSVSIALCGGSPDASADYSPFSFQVCNKTDTPASVAVYYTDLAIAVMWHAQGWWVVNLNQCTVIGSFPKGWFYYYAKSSNRDWVGSNPDWAICVSNSQFTRADFPGSNTTCSSDQKKVFTRNFVETPSLTWTLD